MKVRIEAHRRATFAYEQAEKWFGAMKHHLKGGNILTGKATVKFLQARRIYIHYQNEYQKNQDLPLSK